MSKRSGADHDTQRFDGDLEPAVQRDSNRFDTTAALSPVARLPQVQS